MGPIYNNHHLEFNASSPYNNDTENNESILHRLERGGKVPSAEKFRRMICLTHISCGGCPYGDKCVFLHDPRLMIASLKMRSTKQPRATGQPKDTFYWPDMDKENVYNVVNMNGLPVTGQNYSIPGAFSTNSTYHDRAMFSMWEHFLDVCGSISNNNKLDNGSNFRGFGNDFRSYANDSMNFKQALFKMNAASRSEFREPLRNITNEAPFKKAKDDIYVNCEENRHLPKRNRLPVFVELAGRCD